MKRMEIDRKLSSKWFIVMYIILDRRLSTLVTRWKKVILTLFFNYVMIISMKYERIYDET